MKTEEFQIITDNTPLRLMIKQEIPHPDLWYAKLVRLTNKARDFKLEHSKRKESLMNVALMLLDYTSETKNLFSSYQQQVINHIKDRLNEDPIVPEDIYYD